MIIRKQISDSRYQNAFTLIELLIVMAIISILAGISVFALQGARTQGRDAKRKADIEVIRSALELYKADCNLYPAGSLTAGTALTANCTGSTNTYLARIPSDPSSATASYRYCPAAGNRTYTIYSHLEDSTAATITGCGACEPANCKYSVTSP